MASLATAVNSPSGAHYNKTIQATKAGGDADFDPNIGFCCDVAGTLSFRLRADATVRQMEVQAGEVYYGDVAHFDADLSETGQVITVFFRVT